MNRMLERWNGLPAEAATMEMLSCCGSRTWAGRVVQGRPYADEEALLITASVVWSGLEPEDWLEAFRSHPRIGERHAESKTTRASTAWSAAEQKNVQSSTAAVRQAIEEGNRRYEERFGRIFIVCAAGKQPSEILGVLERRLRNDKNTELRESAAEQEQIFELRLRKWLSE